MMTNMPVITILFSLSWVVGMVIFANYADCDPLSLGYISKYDEIVPFYVEDKLSYMPGLLGLIMATLFNSALTLAVSNLNSLATVTFEDFLTQIPALSNLRDTQQLHMIKIIGVIYGVIVVGISFLVAMLSGVIESSMLMTSATSGPLLGVFVLAMLVPCCNWKGAASGMIFSHITTLWITFGHLTVPKDAERLSLSTEGCQNDTFSSHLTRPPGLHIPGMADDLFSTTTMKPAITADGKTPVEFLYGITYMYYAFIGSMTTIIVGIIVSLITADSKKDAYEEHLLHPLALKVSKMLPGKPRLYASSTRLDDQNAVPNPDYPNSVPSVVINVSNKLSPFASNDTTGKTQMNSAYLDKLNAIKGASLDVTNEITKGTRL